MNILIVYGTTDGQTAKISQFLRGEFRALGHQADAIDARADPNASSYDGVIVAASVHVSSFQRPVVTWVRRHATALAARPNVFVSVCLSIVQDTERVRADLDAVVARFVRQSGWQPARVEFVAGALAYSRYGFFKKLVMRYMSRQSGVPTDPHRDYEYTDWEALRRLAREFVAHRE